MSSPEHFDGCAAAYRQLAQNSPDERSPGDMFEIAGLFSSMANDLRLLRQAHTKPHACADRHLMRFSGVRLKSPDLLVAAAALASNAARRMKRWRSPAMSDTSAPLPDI